MSEQPADPAPILADLISTYRSPDRAARAVVDVIRSNTVQGVALRAALSLPGEAERFEQQVLADNLCSMSHAIDSSPSYTLCEPETVLWRRCAKVSEEAGEVIKALGGVVGENPRKGITHTIADLEAELLDTAAAALGAVAHLHDNEGDPILLLATHVRVVHARLRASGRALVLQPTP